MSSIANKNEVNERTQGWSVTFPPFNTVESSKPLSANSKQAMAHKHECDLQAPPKNMKQLSAGKHILKSKHASPNRDVKPCASSNCSTNATSVQDCANASGGAKLSNSPEKLKAGQKIPDRHEKASGEAAPKPLERSHEKSDDARRATERQSGDRANIGGAQLHHTERHVHSHEGHSHPHEGHIHSHPHEGHSHTKEQGANISQKKQ